MFFDKIKPDMKKIAKYTCQAAQDIVEGRKNSHELFGYDFMVDENFNTWLIEINSSPAMDYSTVKIRIFLLIVLANHRKISQTSSPGCHKGRHRPWECQPEKEKESRHRDVHLHLQGEIHKE